MTSLPATELRLVSLGGLALALLLLGFASPAQAGECGWTPDKTPSTAAPENLWNGLQPTEIDGLPDIRDTSDFNLNGGYTHTRPFFRSIDAEGGFVFAGYNLGMHIYQASGQLQGRPNLISSVTVDSLQILHRNPHDYFLVTDVDVPDGENDIAVMTGWDGMGMVVVDTSDKFSPRVIYQDAGASGSKYGQGVHVTRIDGRLYGFLAGQRFTGAGLWMYDLTRAQEVGLCVEERPGTVNPVCNGIFQAKLSADPQSHVDSAGNDSVGHFLAFSSGAGGQGGMEIWDISNPEDPVFLLEAMRDRRVEGLAMWNRGSDFYLAVTKRNPDEAAIYDISCVVDGCFSNPLEGTPLYEFPMPGAKNSTRSSAQVSENGGVPFLYFGRANSASIDGLQAEWLFDVTDPTNPAEVTGGNPKNGNVGQPTMMVDGEEVGYWSWYYSCHTSGTNSFEPADGRVMDGYFYRAGGGILDVHEMKDVAPRIQISAPAKTYQGTGVTVSASALNCTPSSSGWDWNVGDGVVSGSGASVSVSWPTTGDKSVSATNTACSGALVTPAVVTVQQSAPAVGSVTSNVSQALVCSPVTFTANSVTGKPTLSHAWEIVDSQDAVVTTLSGGSTSATWDTSQTPQPDAGTYRARYTATNDAGSATELSAGVLIDATGDLGFNPGINAAVPDFGDVDFQANATGATRWIWDFGDGNTLDTTDPTVGPAPRHRYEEARPNEPYVVTLEIQNCKGLNGNDLSEWPVSTTEVTITEVNPLIISQFEAKENNSFGVVFPFETNKAITFLHTVEGEPEFYDYDWNGDGIFEETSSTEVSEHTYTQAGDYQPVLRVRRGTASKVYEHLTLISVESGNPPSISLNGSTSAKVGDSVTFRATASNCTPSNTWNWTATGGGQITGNGAQVTVRWSSTGTKTVRATNSACGSASGSRSISITSDSPPPPPPAPGNNLEAVISASAVVVEVGDGIEFDGSASKGSPTAYEWDFGDGATATGAKVTHGYNEPGTYIVELRVLKAGDCPFGYCTAVTTRQVRIDGPSVVTGGNGCTGDQADDSKLLCLKEGRFEVEVAWRDHHNGNRTGVGGANSFGGYEGVTGSFWFFNPNSVDLIVKVLGTQEGDHWVFYGGLSDVYYEMTVTDTETGKVRSYENLEGSICGVADTAAFLKQDGNQGQSQAAGYEGSLHFSAAGVGSVADAFRPGLEDDEEEEETSETLSLLDGRFDVTINWVNQHAGDATGVGTAIPGTNQVGYFWFFNQRNLEVVAKMVDGREVNGYWWVFWGGLSDVNYTIKVVDVVSGREWTRTNPPGSFCGGSDTAAFAAD